jgi:hypothetical protein
MPFFCLSIFSQRQRQRQNTGILRCAQNGGVLAWETRKRTLVPCGEGDFKGAYPFCVFSVADAFELAAELGGRVVGIAIFVFVGAFGLALLEGVVEVGLGEGLEREQDEAEGGCGGIEAMALLVRITFSTPSEALEEKYGGEEHEKGEKGPADDEVGIHGRPFVAVERRRGSARQ